MTIEINERLYKEFTAWAKANGMDDKAIAKYIESAFREKFTLDKYGDLNEKISQPEPPKKRTTKKSEQPKPVEPTNELINEQINEPINEQIKEEEKEEKPKRKTKVLASK